MLTIIVGVTAFVVLVLLMVAVLMGARAKLVKSGDVLVFVNDDPAKTLHAKAGGTLLSTLAEQKIFIPSACGGKGTCGVCKVEVFEGGGTLLPTETGHVSRGEARAGVRFRCPAVALSRAFE